MDRFQREDPFHWHVPNRNETMMLQTVNQRDIGLMYKGGYKGTNYSLQTQDIYGAQPHSLNNKFYNKPGTFNTNMDIDRSSPTKLFREQNRHYNYLRSYDIKGSKPQVNKFTTTRRPTNPLEPQYNLSKVQIRVATPPRFIRDSISIKDIEGAQARQIIRKKCLRNTMDISDIDGARAVKKISGVHVRLDRAPRDANLNVKDINEYMHFETKRTTNPLVPTYKVQNNEGVVINYGYIDGSKPKRLHPLEVNKAITNLNSMDIVGAQSNTIPERFLRTEFRRCYKNTTRVDDIPGAQAGSLVKGMKTKRHTNPIIPDYKFLDYVAPKQQSHHSSHHSKQQSHHSSHHSKQQSHHSKQQSHHSKQQSHHSQQVQVEQVPQNAHVENLPEKRHSSKQSSHHHRSSKHSRRSKHSEIKMTNYDQDVEKPRSRKVYEQGPNQNDPNIFKGSHKSGSKRSVLSKAAQRNLQGSQYGSRQGYVPSRDGSQRSNYVRSRNSQFSQSQALPKRSLQGSKRSHKSRQSQISRPSKHVSQHQSQHSQQSRQPSQQVKPPSQKPSISKQIDRDLVGSQQNRSNAQKLDDFIQ